MEKTTKLTSEQKQEIKRKYWHDVRKTTGIAAIISLVLGLILLRSFFPLVTIPFLVIFVAFGTFIISTYVYMLRLAKQYPELVMVKYGYQFTKDHGYDPNDPNHPLNAKEHWSTDPTGANSLQNPLSPTYPGNRFWD